MKLPPLVVVIVTVYMLPGVMGLGLGAVYVTVPPTVFNAPLEDRAPFVIEPTVATVFPLASLINIPFTVTASPLVLCA